MTTKTYVGDTATRITLDCGTNITTATARSIEVRKPDGSSASWAASLSGTDALYFDTLAGTLDMPGTWRLQAKVTIGTGTWLGQTVQLVVYPAFA